MFFFRIPSGVLRNYCVIQRNLNGARNYYTVKRKQSKDENYLTKHIYQKIKAKGAIPVADYMREVLTHPLQGYYMTKDVFGEQGDFVTSPEVSQMFGEMIGVWFLNEWHKLGSPSPVQVVELGPGRGTLSGDVLKIFNYFKALHQVSLHLVEVSPHLSELQAKTLCQESTIKTCKGRVYQEGISNFGIPVKWYKELKDVPAYFSLVIAHEFFDALPVHKFHKVYGNYREVLVDAEITENGDPKFKYVLARNETPIQKVLLRPDEDRDHVEICPDAQIIYRNICERTKSHGGIVLICDYGHNGEGTDTFRAFRKHEQVDPLVLPGTADLTADVDFSQIRHAAEEVGDLICLGPVTQREFLLRVGINHRYKALLQSASDQKDRDNLKECYNFLTDTSKMGERFKFMALVPATVKKIIEKFPVVGF